ncbi:MaoC/PaaZ C-terminal domain-containing protein [Micromonospora sp. NPDC003776]
MEKTVLYHFLTAVPEAAAIWSALLLLALGVLAVLVARPERDAPPEVVPDPAAEEAARRADLCRYADEVAVAAAGAARPPPPPAPRRPPPPETVDFRTYAENLRPHERGRQLDVVLVGSVDGEEVWRGVSTYLGRERQAGGGPRRDRGERPTPPAPSARWRLTPRVGTDYARVSGDHNPIHTSRLGARLFGFPRPIAHGMWSKARCLAALESRLPEAYTVDVAFKLPVPLPSTVAFSATATGADWDFALHSARDGRPHLVGTVR